MDITIKYEKAIIQLFEEYDKLWRNADGLNHSIVVDTVRKSFVFITFGWNNEDIYTHLVCFHLEISNEKVWIHENNTEIMIVNDLIDNGVNENDIIIGFAERSINEENNTKLLR